MRLFAFVAILILATGAPTTEMSFDSDPASPLERVARASVPPDLARLLTQSGLHMTHELVFDELNPFYLCADFDGDGHRDYAVLVRPIGARKTTPAEIVVIRNRANGVVHWLKKDVGGSLPGPAWWVLYSGTDVPDRPDLNGGAAPALQGDGIVVARPESSCALVHWDGKKFRLYWLTD